MQAASTVCRTTVRPPAPATRLASSRRLHRQAFNQGTAVRRLPRGRRSGPCVVNAVGKDDEDEVQAVTTATSTSQPKGLADKLMRAVGLDGGEGPSFDAGAAFEKLATRYDWLSAGLGALLGTSYGVYRGQPASKALGITLCATVIAVAIDELIKDREAGQR